MKLLDVVAEHHMPITVSLQYRCLVKNVSAVVGVFLQNFFKRWEKCYFLVNDCVRSSLVYNTPKGFGCSTLSLLQWNHLALEQNSFLNLDLKK